jgi:hypothetical protein
MFKSKCKSLSLDFLLRITLYFIIAGVVAFYYRQNIIIHPQLNLSIQTSKPAVIQLFCDAGDGFNEALSNKLITSLAQQDGESIGMNVPNSCKHLRLDLGGAGNIIKINSATLATSNGNSIDILSNILSPALLNEVKINESNRREFIAVGNDPYVLLNGDFLEATKISYSFLVIIKMLILFAIVFFLLATLAYWVNRGD